MLQHHIVANRRAAREPYLGGQQTMPADRHIVTDLDLIVDFRAFADDGVAQTAAIDGGPGADLDLVLDHDPADLRYLKMAFGPKKHKIISVLPDAAAGMDQYLVADQGGLDRSVGADIAVPADPDIGADHHGRPDHGPGAD